MNALILLSALTVLGAEPDVPTEMKTLDKMVGIWQVKADVKMPIPALPGTEDPLTRESHRVLDDRFVRVKAVGPSGELRYIAMYTYHVPTAQFRMWAFMSGGEVADATGNWDDDKQTLHFTGENALGTWTYSIHFVDDTMKEVFVLKDASDVVKYETHIMASRKK